MIDRSDQAVQHLRKLSPREIGLSVLESLDDESLRAHTLYAPGAGVLPKRAASFCVYQRSQLPKPREGEPAFVLSLCGPIESCSV